MKESATPQEITQLIENSLKSGDLNAQCSHQWHTTFSK